MLHCDILVVVLTTVLVVKAINIAGMLHKNGYFAFLLHKNGCIFLTLHSSGRLLFFCAPCWSFCKVAIHCSLLLLFDFIVDALERIAQLLLSFLLSLRFLL